MNKRINVLKIIIIKHCISKLAEANERNPRLDVVPPCWWEEKLPHFGRLAFPFCFFPLACKGPHKTLHSCSMS